MSRSPVYEIESLLDNFLAALCLRLKLYSSSDLSTLELGKCSESGKLPGGIGSSEFMVMFMYDEFSNSTRINNFNMSKY